MATTSKANFGRPIEAHYPYQAVLEYLLAASMLSNTGINAIMSLYNANIEYKYLSRPKLINEMTL